MITRDPTKSGTQVVRAKMRELRDWMRELDTPDRALALIALYGVICAEVVLVGRDSALIAAGDPDVAKKPAFRKLVGLQKRVLSSLRPEGAIVRFLAAYGAITRADTDGLHAVMQAERESCR